MAMYFKKLISVLSSLVVEIRNADSHISGYINLQLASMVKVKTDDWGQGINVISDHISMQPVCIVVKVTMFFPVHWCLAGVSAP